MTMLPWDAELPTMLGFGVRATVVLATGFVLAWLTRKESAQTRHRLWTATLFVLLLLPPTALWAPAWELPLLPSGTDAAGEAPEIVSGVVQPARAPVEDGSPGRRGFPGWSGAAAAGPGLSQRSGVAVAGPERPPGTTETAVAAEGLPRPAVAPARPTVDESHAADPVHLAAEQASRPTPLPHPMVVWAIGCLAGLVVLAAGLLRWRGLVRKGSPVQDTLWLQEMQAVARSLGLRRRVRLIASDAITTPMTGGLWKPVILLPASSADWDPERRRVVLMHEMVHVCRCDALRQLVRGVVLALYWFHPLAWVAARFASICREEACDERVLQLGSRPSEYARHLMSLAAARSGFGPAPLAALSLVQRSRPRLEKRIMAILRPHRPHTSALVTGCLLAVTGLLGVSTAIAHPVPIGKESDSGVVPTESVQVHEREHASSLPANPVASPPQSPISASVIGEAGKQMEVIAEAGKQMDVAGAAAPDDDPAGRVEGGANRGGALHAERDAAAGASLAEAPDAGQSPISESSTATSITDGFSASGSRWLQDVSCDRPSGGSEDPEDEGVGGFPGGTMNVANSGAASLEQGDDQYVWSTLDDVLLCMRMHGAVDLEEGRIRSLAADAWVFLESRGDGLHRMVIRPGDGLEHEWSIGGEGRPFDESAREWRDGMLAVLGGRLEIKRIREAESELNARILNLGGGSSVVAGLQSQVRYRQSVVSDLLDQISYHQEVFSGLRDEIAYHRGVVSGMRAEIGMHRDRVAAFQEVKSSYEAQITAIIPRLKTADTRTRDVIAQSIKDWEERIKDIEAQIEAYDLYGKVGTIEDEIRKYDLDTKVQRIEQQITGYGRRTGLEEMEAQVEQQSALLDEAARRAEEAIRRETLDEEGRRVYSRDVEIANLEQRIRDLDADATVSRIEQMIAEEMTKLLELVRRL